MNSERFRAAQMPAFNGHGTARGLARLYSVMASGRGSSGALLSPALYQAALTEQWHCVDALGLNSRMARGFRLTNEYSPYNGNPNSFGHSGIGGAVAFGDPDRGLGFCFLTNRLAPGPGASPSAVHLLDALESCTT